MIFGAYVCALQVRRVTLGTSKTIIIESSFFRVVYEILGVCFIISSL